MAEAMKKMLLLDFDGTLFQPGRFISEEDVNLLKECDGRLVRVIATGRSLYSLKKVIDEDFPIDYLIFSTGAGIMDWATKRLIHASQLNGSLVDRLIEVLKAKGHSFFVHQPLPDNHMFYYHSAEQWPPDFKRRFELYRSFAHSLSERNWQEPASQILVISPHLKQLSDELKSFEDQIRLVRTTSPLDGKTIWLEIFEKNTNKALAAQWLSTRLKIAPENTIAIGNDFNDVALLEWAGQAFVVENAPLNLKKRFRILKNTETGILATIKNRL